MAHRSDCVLMGSPFRLSDQFWLLAQRLIPRLARVHPLGGGRPRVPDRRILGAIFFVVLLYRTRFSGQ
jgi:hypothetical protein